MRGTLKAKFEDVHNTLLELGYKYVRRNHYRKNQFHVILQPKDSRVDLHIHVDKFGSWTPTSKHYVRKMGKDITAEFQNICGNLKAKT